MKMRKYLDKKQAKGKVKCRCLSKMDKQRRFV